ncbi:probable inactive receptor kinase At4g23740 isoform X2 [Salvia miltiorrhiza]|uniref:probable inactive receptor kinase At4g23740 isoform X2 n=1 Tax=Salvia miltiorrhiza TaxID=226208 RepID=UPI0025AD7560|nr:probable inactive receptor kinase At4g23740 isoform X2 [Salvia miltiorrhiza]XP_057798378.1 probable inactive receptor kinase At4g23740 isoform X2 [Salvia miltiorrhiza]XP_057798379.1 probable inactive receptor kinase At4g23740 isoform X2 [Salvia miltiorrhiza]
MIKMLQIGIRCVAKSPKKRPKIVEVVEMLEDIESLTQVSRSLQSTSEEGKLIFLEDVNPIFEIGYLLEASAEVVGKGSFGTSYKTTLDNGSIFVVKRFTGVNPTFKDFQQHMELFGRMNHINVGRLKAYYYGRDEKLLLYDYYNQGSISSLHGTRGVGGIPLDWRSRVKIALGAARGIAHIHGQHQKLVLGNIKSANIFLNEQNHSILAFDAALANLISPERLSGVLDSAYCSPEVANSGAVSQASDVYSFGVVLLQLFFGESSQEYDSLAVWVQWVGSVYRTHEWPAELFLRHGSEQAATQVLEMAVGCVSIVLEHRPTIFEVVKVLEEIDGVEPQTIVEDTAWGEYSSVQSGFEYLVENLLPMLSP